MLASGRALLHAACAIAFFFAPAATAQQETSNEKIPPARSLRSRLGVEAARPLLHADATELRLRAFERLGATGTSAALELLADALASGGAARNARERLAVVRELAPHVREERARGALVRAMGGALTRDEPADALVRQTAALALARSGDDSALAALAQALRQPGRVSETARLALRAHRPERIAPVLEARGIPTPALSGLLGDLGDPAGAVLAARFARTGTPALRAESLLALFKLDRPAAVALARAFQKEKHRAIRTAAARVLALGRDPAARTALASLLADRGTVGDALSIALDAPLPEFATLFARMAPSDPGDEERLFAVLGRTGGRVALARLERALLREETGWAAAYALALSRDDGAEEILERALERPATRRNALRAALLRQEAYGDGDVSGVGAALEALERSKLVSDRAAAAFCRAVLDPEIGEKLVTSRDRFVAAAAARAALRPPLARVAARRLAGETDEILRAALAIALLVPEAADEVPNAVLVSLLESRGAAAHLAAFALAARDGAELRPRIRELLASGDPLLRAHVALGLSRSKESTSVGLLDETYRAESEPDVRRAIIATLARRPEPGRERTLRLAKDLDPDERTRAIAARALGRGERQPAVARGTAWIRVAGTRDAAARLAVLVTPEGLSLPLLPDPDGSVTLVGLPRGSVGVTLASPAPDGDSPRRGSP